MKKRTLFFLSVCAVALNGYVVHADSLEAPSQLVTVPNLPGTGGQLTVVEEAGQMKAILSNITGEIVGVTGQFKSETNTGKTIAFTIDASGQYVAYLDRTSFSNEDQAFTLALTANLIDGSAHNLDDYSFNWVKVAENTNDDSDLIENTNATEASKPVSSGTVVDSVEKDSSSSASETQSSSTASSSLAATVTDSSNVTSASTLTSTQTTSSVGSQLRSASLMRIATNSSAQSSAVTKASQIDQTLELKYTGSINSGEVIKFAVWSDEKGQDDIVWYNADQTGAAYADLRKHRDYGKYNIHTYVNRNGKMVYLNEIVVDVKASGTVTISNVDSQTGSFDVHVTNVSAPRGLSKVLVPTWTESDGQDDIIYHTADRQSDGSYKVTVPNSKHKYGTGKYNIHLYYRGTDGSMTYVAQTTTTLPELKTSGNVSVSNVNAQSGSFDVHVTNVSAPRGLSKVLVPTWTESDGQDDIIYHTADRQSDGSYKVTVPNSKHKYGTGKYHIHVYYQGTDGSMTYVNQTTTNLPELKASGDVSVSNVNAQNGSFDVTISNITAPHGLSKVLVPTWTEADGQDDIIWHTAERQSDGSYKVTVPNSKHKYGTGKYNIHLYYRGTDGSMTYVAQTTTTLPESKTSGNVSVSNVNAQSGSFDVHVTNVSAPRGLSKVLVPTWTEAGGQDDIIWHTAERQSDGSYKVTVPNSKHKYGTGKYHIHVYYQGTDGSMTYVNQTTTNLPELKASGDVSVSNVNAQNGSFDVTISNITAPHGLSKVLVPTWTEADGQDDIIWHTAERQSDGSYKVTVPNSKHKYGTGKYHIHVYYQGTDGSMTYVNQTTTTLPELKASGDVSVSNVNAQNGSFDVTISNITAPRGLSKVLVPTWTEAGGQDDIIWHTAERQSDGSYKVTVPNSKHKYGTGKYHIHVYYQGTDGSMTYVNQTTTNLPELKASGDVSVSNVDSQTGSFDVTISNITAPHGLSKVLVPTWTEAGGQDDIIWHTAERQSDGSYKVTVPNSKHKYGTGKYHIHVYYQGTDGSMTYVNQTTTNLPESSTKRTISDITRSYTVYIDPGHGGVDSGASYGGVQEKNLALSVANKLKANLIQLGYQVLMTRTADYNVDFKTERSKMTNQSNADLFISIHFNSTGSASSNATGIETYWYQYDPEYQPKINAAMHNDPTRLAESEILANQVQTSLISGTGAVNRGVRRDTFAVLRETAIPAILVELGFMDNPSDLQKINQDSYQTKLANALAQGIDNWYGAVGSKPTSGTSTQKKSTEQSQMTTSQQSFFNKILPAIQQVSQKNSIVTSVMLAQSILESGWGTSQLATNAYNIFGIKADSSWKGNTYTVQTKEVVNGKTITVEKQFRAYKSLLESISDYGNFFTSTAWRTKNYQRFLQATNYETALTSLLASGYATDPAYAEKLKSLIQRYGLDQYDLN